MSLVTWLFGLFKALAAIAQLAGLMRELASKIAAWYLAEQEEATLKEIIDNAAFAMGAKTDEERMEVSRRWHATMHRSRISGG